MSTSARYPINYKDWIIKRFKTLNSGFKLAAYNWRTDKYINPVHDNLEEIKTAIDNFK